MTRQQQISTKTFQGRSRHLMRDLAEALAARPELDRPRILSFGCSDGSECLDLQDVLPDSEIVGCDVNRVALEKARAACGPGIRILENGSPEMGGIGRFDAVFALSVFCRYPESELLDDVSALYPFALFDQGIAELDGLVEPGGYIVLFNAQYFFEDASVASNYTPVPPSDPTLANGFIEKSLPSGLRATDWYLKAADLTLDRSHRKTYTKNEDVMAIHARAPERVTWGFSFTRPEDAQGRSTVNAIWRKASAPSGTGSNAEAGVGKVDTAGGR